jgi:hypothetical protein
VALLRQVEGEVEAHRRLLAEAAEEERPHWAAAVVVHLDHVAHKAHLAPGALHEEVVVARHQLFRSSPEPGQELPRTSDRLR